MGDAAGWGRGPDVRLFRAGLLIASLLLVFIALAPPASAEEPPEEFAQFGLTGVGAGQTVNPRGMATNPSNGRGYVADLGNQRISEFTAWGEFVKAFGWGVVSGGAAGTGNLVEESTTISSVVTTSKVFKVGQAISGAGIPAGTTIVAVPAGSITLSQPATASGTEVALTAPQGSTNVPVNEQQTVTLSAGVTGGSFKLTYTTPNPSSTTATTASIPYNATPAEVEAALAALPNIGAGNVSVTSPNPGGEAGKGGPYTITFQGTRFADTDVNQLTVTNALTGTSPSAAVATTVVGASAFETCTAGCQGGTAGAGAGQFSNPAGVAVDSAGNVYVAEQANRRVQKFDAAGNFLLMFGGGVNKTTGGNICTKAQLEGGDVCGAGTTGTAPGQFGAWKFVSNFISIGPGDALYVGDLERIQIFDSAGSVTGSIALTGCGFVESLTADPAGDLWVACEQAKIPGVRKIDGAGNVLATVTESGEDPPTTLVPKALATDPGGFLYMVDGTSNPIVRKFTSAGVETTRFGAGQFTASTGIATNSVGDVYVSNFTPTNSYIRGYGPLPSALAPPPAASPTIGAEYATAVGTTTAVLGAEINPNFWPTTYYVQYGTGDCSASPSSCAEQPLPPGAPLSGQGKRLYPTDDVVLTGLTPGTTYHYRFVAVGGGGPPTFGEDRTFTTSGLGLGGLPDGRALEMVSPPAKNSGDVAKPNSDLVDNNFATPQQALPSGEAVTYASVTPFAEPRSAPAASQYVSRRSDSGWTTENVTPPDSEGETKPPVRGFSSDLGFAAVIQREPALAAGAVPNLENIYWRDNASGAYTALMTETPRLTVAKEEFCLTYAGASTDSSHVIFSANGALTPDALEGPGFNLYEWTAAGLRLVNVLPGETPAPPSFGTDFGPGRPGANCETGRAIFQNAISADGLRVFWTDRSAGSQLYARIDGTETIQLDAAQPGAVGPSGGGQFWAASDDGSVVFFTAQNKLTLDAGSGDLYRYDVEARTLTSVTPGTANVSGVIGASDDGSHVYFVATAALSGAASAGKPNLYLWREGEGLRFIATLSNADASDWSKSPKLQTARVSPSGRHLAFQSVADLTGYDNFGPKCVVTSEAPLTYGPGLCPEAFVYDSAAGGGELVCASCDPSGARPAGPTALPTWKTPFEQPRYLSDDGSRLFFTTLDDLGPADTNGRWDVYEFEREGAGTCDAASEAFDPQSGGCAFLISGGTAENDSYFVDASADGRDVFFSSPQRLLPADEDENYDVYDARVGGGFPPPAVPPPPCEGESCKPPPPGPLSLAGPGSDRSQGDGNLHERKPERPCPKGKRAVRRKGKVRCVKRHAHKRHHHRHHHHHKRAHKTGRSAR